MDQNHSDVTTAKTTEGHIQHRPRHERKEGPVEMARQSYVVMKNEIKKFFSGKRMRVFAILMAIIVFIIAVAPYLVNSSVKPYYFVTMAGLIVMMAATLFASISIVSEYEERTALIVFTRPISKTSIFLGKMLACIAVTVGFTAIYYLIAIIVGAIVDGSVSPDLFVSFGMACAYGFACIGIAMAVSSFMKKGSTSTIITFVILAVVFTAISMVLSAAGQDATWLLDQASASIQSSSSEYRDATNAMMNSLMTLLSDPTMFLMPGWDAALVAQSQDPVAVLSVLQQYWVMSPDVMTGMTVVEPDYVKDVVTMLVWGLAGFVASFIIFLRREF